MNSNISCVTQSLGWTMLFMGGLQEFLTERFKDKNHADAARRMGVSGATLSRWISGEVRQKFENCLILAAYLKEDPREIFRLAGREKWAVLFDRVAGKGKVQESLPDWLRIEDGDERWFQLLTEILRGSDLTAIEAIKSNLICFEEKVRERREREGEATKPRSGPTDLHMVQPDSRQVAKKRPKKEIAS